MVIDVTKLKKGDKLYLEVEVNNIDSDNDVEVGIPEYNGDTTGLYVDREKLHLKPDMSLEAISKMADELYPTSVYSQRHVKYPGQWSKENHMFMVLRHIEYLLKDS